MRPILLAALIFIQGVAAHVAPFAKGMYCRNGFQNAEDLNSYEVLQPLYQLRFEEWWLHKRCKNYPPPDGEFLDLPAGGSFTVEVASNRAKTTLSYNGRDTSDWPDGRHYPENYHDHNCITSPNLHTQNQSMAAGTAFAISYTSDINAVTPENLAVFSVAEHTPWKRVTPYQVPANMPACPPGGCICAWGWLPNGCGQPNMYQTPFRCRVTGATSTTPVAKAAPPRWCEDNRSACVRGAKQMVYWNQVTGDNIEVEGFDLSGGNKSPGYNTKLGFAPGAQNDIFVGPPSRISSPSPSTSPNTSSSSQGTTTSSYNIPSDTPSPANNGTTTTPNRPRPSRCRRATLEEVKLRKKSAIVQGVASHLKRRRLSKRLI